MSNAVKAATLAVMCLAGCTSASGPLFSAYSVEMPDGEQAYRVECSGLFEGPGVCRRKAQEICKRQPVRLLESVVGLGGKPDNARELTFQCGEAPQRAEPVTPAPEAVVPPVVPKSLTLSGDASFDTAQATLTPAARAQLDRLIDQARAVQIGTVSVSGYTDTVGPAAYNLGLSRRRAETVSGYLQTHGLKADRFETHAYGMANPVASNNTAEGRARNRRVEVRLSAQDTQEPGQTYQ